MPCWYCEDRSGSEPTSRAGTSPYKSSPFSAAQSGRSQDLNWIPAEETPVELATTKLGSRCRINSGCWPILDTSICCDSSWPAHRCMTATAFLHLRYRKHRSFMKEPLLLDWHSCALPHLTMSQTGKERQAHCIACARISAMLVLVVASTCTRHVSINTTSN